MTLNVNQGKNWKLHAIKTNNSSVLEDATNSEDTPRSDGEHLQFWVWWGILNTKTSSVLQQKKPPNHLMDLNRSLSPAATSMATRGSTSHQRWKQMWSPWDGAHSYHLSSVISQWDRKGRCWQRGVDEDSLHCCCENGDWCSCSVDNSLAIHQKVDHEVDWEDGSGHKNLPWKCEDQNLDPYNP